MAAWKFVQTGSKYKPLLTVIKTGRILESSTAFTKSVIVPPPNI